MTTLGIDPGLSGAVAVYHDDGTVTVTDAPVLWTQVGHRKRRQYEAHKMWALVSPYPGAFAVIEKATPMPKQGVVSTFSTGVGMGLWTGLLVAADIVVQVVPPQTWKRVMLDGTSRDKGAARLVAQRLFPMVDLGKRQDQGRAEALLLAEYGRRLRGATQDQGEGER